GRLRHDLFAAFRRTVHSHIRAVDFDAGVVLARCESEPSEQALQAAAVNRTLREWGVGNGERYYFPLPTPHLELPQLHTPHQMVRAFFKYQEGARSCRQDILSQIYGVDLIPDRQSFFPRPFVRQSGVAVEI